jgi:hypothetical protein
MQRRRRAFRQIAAFFVVLLAALCSESRTARAYEEQLAVDVALGYGALAANDALPNNLVSLDVGAAVGMSDWLVARTAFGYGALVGEGEVLNLGRGRLEVAYLLDILQWVPFFGAGGGLWMLQGPSGLGLRPTGHLWFGVDYLATREWTLGVDVRTGVLWQRGDVVSFTEGQLRFSRMFELF